MPNYHIERLGRPEAIFFIPADKLNWQYMGSLTIKEELHDFLLVYCGVFTTTLIPLFGIYRSKDKKSAVYHQCYQYEVSFIGKDRYEISMGLLMSKLAVIATRIKEECMYLKTGEDACLIYPSSS